MSGLLDIFQPIINSAFLAVLLLITVNNIRRKIDIKIPLLIISYVLIAFGVLSLFSFCYSLLFEVDSEENMFYFLKRATGPMKFNYIFMISCSLILPFTLLLRKLKTNKYYILLVSFLIVLGVWFERFVIIITSLYRGHMPASWASYYPTWEDLPTFLFIIFLISIPFILLIVNIVIDIKRRFKK